jgi:hypothetical protein
MTLRYVGIENEFELWQKGQRINFESTLPDLKRLYTRPFYQCSGTSMRMWRGNALYADGAEPEVCTFPIRLERGFASEAAKALYQARQSLLELISPLDDTVLNGYSIHWNITNKTIKGRELDKSQFLSCWSVPLSLFMLNRWSKGLGAKTKDSARLECMGDHIEDLQQVKAAMLLYAAAALYCTSDLEKHIPFVFGRSLVKGNSFGNGYKIENLVPQGRESKIVAYDVHEDRNLEITAQEWLERIVKHYEPALQVLGTAQERRLLQDFVSGKRKLSIDSPFLPSHDQVINGSLQIPLFSDADLSHVRIDPQRYTREMALQNPMARLLGSIVSNSPIKMEWGHIEWLQQIGTQRYHFQIGELEAIDAFAVIAASLPARAQYRLALARLDHSKDGETASLVQQKGVPIPIDKDLCQKVQAQFEKIIDQIDQDLNLPELPSCEKPKPAPVQEMKRLDDMKRLEWSPYDFMERSTRYRDYDIRHEPGDLW